MGGYISEMGGSAGNTPTVAAPEAFGVRIQKCFQNQKKGDTGLANTLLLA